MQKLYDRPALLLCLTAAFWAGNFVLGRGVAGVIPPVTLSAVRWALASLLLLPIAWPYLRGEWSTIKHHWRILLFLAVIGPTFFNTLTYIGLIYTEALNGLVLNAAAPIFITLAAWLLFRDPITRNEIIGLICGFVGVLFIIAKGNVTSLASFHFNPGDLLLFVAILIWAAYTAFLRKRPQLSWQSFNFVTYAVAGTTNSVFTVGTHAAGETLTLTFPVIMALLYVAIFPSLIAYIFYNRGVELLGPARAGLYMFLVPVFGAILATVFLGEKMQLYHAIGFSVIVAGVIVGSRPARKRVAAPAETEGRVKEAEIVSR